MVKIEDLVSPTAGRDFDDAVDINDFGQIAANGCRNGGYRALRLDSFTSAVAEPGLLALLSLGFLGIGVKRPKKR